MATWGYSAPPRKNIHEVTQRDTERTKNLRATSSPSWMIFISHRAAFDGKEPPFTQTVFQRARAAFGEPDARARDQVFDGARNQNFPDGRLGGHLLGDLHGHAVYPVIHHI